MSVALKSWRANEGPKHLIMMFWIAVNVFLFWRTFMLYFSGAQYYYLHKILYFQVWGVIMEMDILSTCIFSNLIGSSALLSRPRVHVDGPFGSPSEEVFNYEVSLCVAGGIGVTPFACVLQALFDDWRQYKLRRLYFVWVCRDLQSFYWFADLLCGLRERLWRDNRPDYLNVQLYLSNTQGLQVIGEERYRFLSSRLRIGRPKWKLLFQEIRRANQLKRVGVFCCGPKGISKALHTLCNSNPHTGTAFEYNKETFS
uniref:NADPH oxidase 4-like n=1 Tax=Sinocyclocheilus rhinocerous TaxID=307959 RepID=A0A673HVC8_9TELE